MRDGRADFFRYVDRGQQRPLLVAGWTGSSGTDRDFNPQRSAILSTNCVVVKHWDVGFRRRVFADDPVKKRSLDGTLQERS